jgi:diguanylate cyclase (GGDEF)-like protein
MTPNVLIAHHNPALRASLSSMFSNWGCNVTLAADGLEAWTHLQPDDGPRLAILDAGLTGIGAAEICRQLRADDGPHYWYLVVLASGEEIQDATAALDSGADDYISCPLSSPEFRARIQAGLRVVEFQERLAKVREQLYEQATRDSLTGLWNRIAAIQILECEIARATRSGSAIAVVMADLDHFKRINDTRGHLAGDAVLREAARRMSGVLRKYDPIGRYGGEEFLILVPACHLRDVLSVAQRLQESLSRLPFSIGGEDIQVSASFGVCWRDCREPADCNQLLREADTALYAAKRKGRNRVELFRAEVEEAPRVSVACS